MTGPGGRVLAIDPGRVRMGVAVSDPMGIIAQALPALVSEGHERDLAALAEIVRDREISLIVVGSPHNMDGGPGPMTVFAEKLAAALAGRTGLPVVLWDERLSSVQAERVLLEADVGRRERKKHRDGLAAVLILQAYLDRRSLPDPA